jgi:hypothetical protein
MIYCSIGRTAIADYFPAESLIAIAHHRGYLLRVSRHGRVEVDLDAPTWFCVAIAIHEAEIAALIRLRFLDAHI